MIIFANDENTKFCQITLRIKRFIHKRKVIPFYSAKRAVTGFSFIFIFIYLNRATQQVTTQQSKYIQSLRSQELLEKYGHQLASPSSHRSIVFAGWRQCARYLSPLEKSSPLSISVSVQFLYAEECHRSLLLLLHHPH